MFNIAVLVYDLVNDYSVTVVKGISSFFKDKDDVRLIISSVNVPVAKMNNYDYQNWTSVKLLEASQIDGIIVIPNTFLGYTDLETLTKELKGLANKPIVSIAVPMDLPNNKYVKNSCELAYKQVVEHLKNKHNCKRLAFFGAGIINSQDSIERLNHFKKALKECDLEFYPELIFDGDFTPGTARNVLSETIKSKEDVNMDAILCVNDYTAGGCLLLFDELGIKVPDEVKLIGFDDSDFAYVTYPTLSSISQKVPFSGAQAAEILYKELKGEKTDKVSIIESYPVYRQSCGCVSCKTHVSSYVTQDGQYIENDESKQRKDFDVIQAHNDALFNIYNFLNVMDTGTPMEEIMNILGPCMKIARYSALMICLFDSPQTLLDANDFDVPEYVRVQAALNADTDTCIVNPIGEGPKIYLKDRIAPSEFEYVKGGNYLLHPVYSHEKNYGYIFCKSSSSDYLLSAIDLKILSEIIVHAYEYSVDLKQRSQLIEKNVNLSLQTKTDELTQVFNRRGILSYGQQLIDLSVSMDKTGAVFFCDLDGLKKINDTYGHKIGDLAIQTEAKVLKATFRDSDLVGRLSGDEFCVVAPGFPLRKIDAVRQKLIANNEKFSKEAGLPFILSISIGPKEFSSDMSDLQNLLQQADQQLYEEKHIKHQQK